MSATQRELIVMYDRKRTYPIEDVISRITPGGADRVDFDGDLIKMDSARYKCYQAHGTKCVNCGLEGQYFAMERQIENAHNGTGYHFNLYGVDADGHEVMMTANRRVRIKNKITTTTNRYPLCERCSRKLDKPKKQKNRKQKNQI